MKVIACTRKRCRVCMKMVEVGDEAILTDDRYLADAIQWHGRRYPRGAWHLTHPDCFERAQADVNAKLEGGSRKPNRNAGPDAQPLRKELT